MAEFTFCCYGVPSSWLLTYRTVGSPFSTLKNRHHLLIDNLFVCCLMLNKCLSKCHDKLAAKHIVLFCLDSIRTQSLCYKSVILQTINKGNNKITEFRTILQRESQNAYVYKQTKSVSNRKTVNTVMTLTWYRHF